MIRTNDQLIGRIAEEIIWRRKELTELKAVIQAQEKNSVRSRVLIRGGVSLLYAHWEGFVKKSSSYYLEYVASHRLPYKNLASNFVGLSLKSKFIELGGSDKISAGNIIAEFFCNSMDSQSNVPFKKAVETRSNLSSTVLLDILSALGLATLPFETKFRYIDSNIVNQRNHIAHGEPIEINLNEYNELHDEVISLITTYKNEIENASSLRLFERKP